MAYMFRKGSERKDKRWNGMYFHGINRKCIRIDYPYMEKYGTITKPYQKE